MAEEKKVPSNNGIEAIKNSLIECKNHLEEAFRISFYEPNFFRLTSKLDETLVECYKLFNEIDTYEQNLKKQEIKKEQANEAAPENTNVE